MLNKILFKFFGFIDFLKAFLFQWGIKVLVFLFICMVVHNVMKMSEISSRYQGDYKKLISVYEDESKFMNVYSVGEGPKTIVILSDLGSPSPVIENKALVDNLKDQYKVVVLEYFGYGFSMSMSKHERTNDNFAYEIQHVLQNAEINGPYVLMPMGTSNLYAMRFQQNYPELVSDIISIDGLYPEKILEPDYSEYIRAYASNINITSIFELTGYERVLSYVAPNTFFINDLKEKYPDSYGVEEMAVYRNRIGSQYLSRTMVREANKLVKNMEELKDYKYPEGLPVLEILSSENVKKYDEIKSVDLRTLANNAINSSDIQQVVTIDAQMKLNFTSAQEVADTVKVFLQSH